MRWLLLQHAQLVSPQRLLLLQSLQCSLPGSDALFLDPLQLRRPRHLQMVPSLSIEARCVSPWLCWHVPGAGEDDACKGPVHERGQGVPEGKSAHRKRARGGVAERVSLRRQEAHGLEGELRSRLRPPHCTKKSTEEDVVPPDKSRRREKDNQRQPVRCEQVPQRTPRPHPWPTVYSRGRHPPHAGRRTRRLSRRGDIGPTTAHRKNGNEVPSLGVFVSLRQSRFPRTPVAT